MTSKQVFAVEHIFCDQYVIGFLFCYKWSLSSDCDQNMADSSHMFPVDHIVEAVHLFCDQYVTGCYEKKDGSVQTVTTIWQDPSHMFPVDHIVEAVL